jgi:hypothetical protein
MREPHVSVMLSIPAPTRMPSVTGHNGGLANDRRSSEYCVPGLAYPTCKSRRRTVPLPATVAADNLYVAQWPQLAFCDPEGNHQTAESDEHCGLIAFHRIHSEVRQGLKAGCRFVAHRQASQLLHRLPILSHGQDIDGRVQGSIYANASSHVVLR